MRNIPVELVNRYEEAGWWTRETLGEVLARGLAAAPGATFRSYGSSEHPSITGSSLDAPEDKRLLTDGRPMPGVEIKLAQDGEICSRGPDLCLGYVDEELTATAFDDDGYLTITDRKADVIIRGGENISALEVEEVLLTMPGIAEAVVVAATDARLGERVAAVLRLKPGHPLPTADDIREHFGGHGVARQKWPELVLEVADYPRTPSGKVQKRLVRQGLGKTIAVASS